MRNKTATGNMNKSARSKRLGRKMILRKIKLLDFFLILFILILLCLQPVIEFVENPFGCIILVRNITILGIILILIYTGIMAIRRNGISKNTLIRTISGYFLFTITISLLFYLNNISYKTINNDRMLKTIESGLMRNNLNPEMKDLLNKSRAEQVYLLTGNMTKYLDLHKNEITFKPSTQDYETRNNFIGIKSNIHKINMIIIKFSSIVLLITLFSLFGRVTKNPF